MIKELVERFERNYQSYRSAHYNETQVRREFIDPFFELLGWDVGNQQGHDEAYKDVIHEDAIKIGGTVKAPDYCFRVGNKRKFFLEAKKPSVNLKDDIIPAFQLRRYAWTAKFPLSILTDFEELVVYDCRRKPFKTDKTTTARVLYLRYSEYVDRWEEISSLFSRESVLQGSLDKWSQKNKKPHGSATVGEAFLQEIDYWREILAQNLALRNSGLTSRELNFAVQITIDRIIFLRICEDRSIEPYGQLSGLLKRHNVYEQLCALFRRADERYNSGLFHFRNEKGNAEAPDDLTLRLSIDDSIFHEIIKNLYYPDSPYEFSVMPVEILGEVYEQFLGKVITLTSNHRAVVEEKPEVRKAGGVYYTPTYIVEYITKNTIGKMLDNSTPNQAAKLKIVDPACGSGTFLINAYKHLLDWHRDWYVNDGVAKHSKVLYQAAGNEWRLTTTERKRILLNSIHGVDIDTQAVEVTKLSLLLKVLEGESGETLATQLQLFQERALPDLSQNIKCGNSLIGSDFYEGKQMSFLEDEEQVRINVFDWETEFSKIMDTGGFDAVIGNPPWISLTGKFRNVVHTPKEIDYLVNHFSGNTYMPNMYEYFVAKGLVLTKDKGFFSFIVPDRLGYNNQFVQLRHSILTESQVISLLYKTPFPKVVADTLIFVLRKGEIKSDVLATVSEYDKPPIQCSQRDFMVKADHSFEYFENKGIAQLTSKISSLKKVKALNQFCDSTSGYGGKSELIHAEKTHSKQIPTFKGASIGRYELRKGYWFDFKPENITGRTTDKAKLGASPKILLRKTGDHIIATFDDSGVFPEQSLYFLYNFPVEKNIKFILGLLNSSLLSFYYRAKSLTNKSSIAQVKKVQLDQLPIYSINFSNPDDKASYNKMVEMVDQMLLLHKQLESSKTNHDQTRLQRQLHAIDHQIDCLVYELYKLTEEEIATIKDEQLQWKK